jgi:hypothetical protein
MRSESEISRDHADIIFDYDLRVYKISFDGNLLVLMLMPDAAMPDADG